MVLLLKAVYGGAGVSSGGEGDAKGRWTTRTLRAKTSSVSEKIERKTCLFSSRLMPLFLPCRGPREGKKEEKRRRYSTRELASKADATSTGPSQETYHDGRFPARLKTDSSSPLPAVKSSQVSLHPLPDRSTLFVPLVSCTATAEDPNFGSSRRAVGVYDTRQQLRGEDQTSGRFQAQGGEERSS